MPIAIRVLIPIVCAALIVGLVVYVVRSFRRGGVGPPITMPAWTRNGRERTNNSYVTHGWAEPYDEQGIFCRSHNARSRRRTAPDPC
jgi:hypothetical protein